MPLVSHTPGPPARARTRVRRWGAHATDADDGHPLNSSGAHALPARRGGWNRPRTRALAGTGYSVLADQAGALKRLKVAGRHGRPRAQQAASLAFEIPLAVAAHIADPAIARECRTTPVCRHGRCAWRGDALVLREDLPGPHTTPLPRPRRTMSYRGRGLRTCGRVPRSCSQLRRPSQAAGAVQYHRFPSASSSRTSCSARQPNGLVPRPAAADPTRHRSGGNRQIRRLPRGSRWKSFPHRGRRKRTRARATRGRPHDADRAGPRPVLPRCPQRDRDPSDGGTGRGSDVSSARVALIGASTRPSRSRPSTADG